MSGIIGKAKLNVPSRVVISSTNERASAAALARLNVKAAGWGGLTAGSGNGF